MNDTTKGCAENRYMCSDDDEDADDDNHDGDDDNGDGGAGVHPSTRVVVAVDPRSSSTFTLG